MTRTRLETGIVSKLSPQDLDSLSSFSSKILFGDLRLFELGDLASDEHRTTLINEFQLTPDHIDSLPQSLKGERFVVLSLRGGTSIKEGIKKSLAVRDSAPFETEVIFRHTGQSSLVIVGKESTEQSLLKKFHEGERA